LRNVTVFGTNTDDLAALCAKEKANNAVNLENEIRERVVATLVLPTPLDIIIQLE